MRMISEEYIYPILIKKGTQIMHMGKRGKGKKVKRQKKKKLGDKKPC
jgi:hypothetical protein